MLPMLLFPRLPAARLAGWLCRSLPVRGSDFGARSTGLCSLCRTRAESLKRGPEQDTRADIFQAGVAKERLLLGGRKPHGNLTLLAVRRPERGKIETRERVAHHLAGRFQSEASAAGMDPVNQGTREFERQRCRGEGMIVGHAWTGWIRENALPT